MKNKAGLVLIIAILSFLGARLAAQQAEAPENFVFFNLNRAGIRAAWFRDSPTFVGAQIKYTWKSLEPKKGLYDFDAIREDLDFLSSRGKKLFIQLQDVSFDPKVVNLPDYLLTESEYHGGVDPQYSFSSDADADARKAGLVARRWDPAVAGRFHTLLEELGKNFDGRIEGLSLPETSVDFGMTGRYYPSLFTPVAYRDAVVATMKAARHAFLRSTVIQYANFMPGEWLPWDDKGLLASVFENGRLLGVGLGGPDLIPYRKGQMNHSYFFAQKYKGLIKTGYAVQEGNYSQRNAKTSKGMTIDDLYRFATDVLGATYLFWFPEEPYFTRDLLPYLEDRAGRAERKR